ncbi:MAG: SgcJ/EcaC family oxidoreductase [Candidatus Eiseniibacteriota bacterium]
MAVDLATSDRAVIENIVGRLEAAWNAMDGVAFGTPFASDADFVNVRGDHFQGREAIVAGHVGIFRTIYAGSSNRYTVETVRPIRPDVAVAHVRAVLDVPQGPLAGRHTARFSAVLTKEPGGWEIASFHNTLEAPPRP